MERIFNQLRRIYADNGNAVVDFTEQETQLRNATDKIMRATVELVKASERLNAAASKVGKVALH